MKGKMDQETQEWYDSRPKMIQEMYDKWPPGTYRMKEDAPYGLTAPGIIVELFSYRESGEVTVVVLPENKTEKVITHEKVLGLKHGRTREEMAEIHKAPIRAAIDPQWLDTIPEK